MENLSLRLLGNFEATLNERPFTKFRTAKVKALLVFLVIEAPTVHQREVLQEFLWPGLPQKSAQVNLRQILYQHKKALPKLKSTVGETAVAPLIADRQTIQLNSHYPITSDATRLANLLKQSWRHSHTDLLTCANCRTWLEEAIELYQGDFLADFSVYDSNSFEAWAHAKRETLRRQTLDALDTLTQIYLAEEDFQRAERTARRQLNIDNLRENAYRQLMQILASTGRRSEALSLYDDCRRLLAEELGMSPAKKTTALSEQVKGGSLSLVTNVRQGIRGYDVGDKLGEGSFGAVYKAYQKGIGREVAIKIIHAKYANQPRFIRRFEAEAQMVARLEYPHIVPLYDYWREPDSAFLVMRWLRGGSLQDQIDKGQLDVNTAVTFVTQIAGALHAAHRQKIVHRDVKPANILLDNEGNAYLSDFGIARDNSNNSQLTLADEVLGSPNYISPEQLLGEEISPAADIYALGLVLYTVLTGAVPYSTSSMVELIQKQLNEPLPLVASQRPELPTALDDVIQQATAKKAEDRFPDMPTFSEALRRATGVTDNTATMDQPTVTAVSETDIINPYKGLQAFQAQDADHFYGRQALTEQLLERLSPSVSLGAYRGEERFLALVGPSGSGKSSVVKAGLIPALQNGALPGSEDWFVVEMSPGNFPMEELEAALFRVAVAPPPSLLEPLQKDEHGLMRVLKRLLPQEKEAERSSQLLLVIDQFEELFTLVQDEADRNRFLDSLFAALTDVNSRLRVIITLRADFYDRPLQLPRLGDWLRRRTELVLPLTVAELEQAITVPAANMGVTLEAGLAAEIIAEVHEQPGALPLMQYALTELFERRDGRTITLNTYKEIGGITGALARRANETYTQLNEAGRTAARELFLRLVTLGEGVEDTRRRVPIAELHALGGREQNWPMAEVIEAFGQYRLLTFDHDPLTREPTVEVAHEALLREWPRLRRWLDQSRDDVRLQRSLATFATEWAQNNQNDGFLLRESRLDLFAGWAATMDLALTPNEQAFLDASIAAREQREAAEQARQQRELETATQLAQEQSQRAEEQTQAAQGLRRRAYYLVGALAIALLLAIVAGLASRQSNLNAETAVANANTAATQEALAIDAQAEALIQAEEAQNNANLAAAAEAVAEEERNLAQENEALAIAAQEEAIAQAEIALFNEAQALSQALTTSAREARTSGDMGLALALAMQAVAIDQPPVEAVRTLNDLAYAPGTAQIYEGGGITPEGNILVNRVLPLNWYNTNLDEGEPLVTVTQDGLVTLWDSNSGEILNQFNNLGSIDSVDELISSGTLTATADGTFFPNAFIFSGSLIPDSTLMILGIGNETDEVNIWDWSTGEKVQTLLGIDIINGGQVFAGPDGESVVAMSRYGGPDTEVDGVPAGFQIVAWDIDSGEQIYRIEGARGERMLTAASVTPDNQIAVIGVSLFDEQDQHQSSRVLIIDMETGEILREAAQAELTENIERSFVRDVAINFAGDQAFIIYGISGQEHTGIFLSLPSGEVEATMPLLFAGYAKFSPDGTQIAVGGGEFATFFTLYDTTTGELIRHLGSANEGNSDFTSDASTAFTPDGKRFVSADGGGNLFLWDVATGDLTERLLGHRGDRFFTLRISPDGQTVITGNVGKMHFWDISQIGAAQVFEEHRDAVEILDVTLSPDGTKAVSTAVVSPNEAILWDTSTFEIIHRLPGIYKTAAFLPDGQSVILGGVADFIDWENRLVHWDIESGEVIGEKNTGVFDALWDLDVSPDGNSLLFVSGTRDIYLYDLETLTEMKRFTDGYEDDGLRSVAFSPDGHTALVGSRYGYAISIDLEADEETRERYIQGGIIWNIVFSEDGERFVVASGDNTVILWDVASGEVIRTFIGHTDSVTKVVFTPDESQLLSTSADGTLILWDVASGEALRTFSEHTAWINVVTLSPDGQLAYSAGNDGQVIVRPIGEIPLDELLATIAENRVLRDFSCEEREQYRILPLCGEDGVVPGSGN